MGELVASVDVGTESVRAGIFDRTGRQLSRAVSPIALCSPAANRAEQDSENIWNAAASALHDARREAGARVEAIAALGFDATCSLVLRDRCGRPLSTALDASGSWDTIVWLDHRARSEATECSAAARDRLPLDPGGISPEMQIPKLLWLKRNHPETWHRLGAAFDLADFLTWKASGSLSRSICTLASKWSFLPRNDPPWPVAFLAALGLGDLIERCGLPRRAVPVGGPVGHLTEVAAAELGLASGVPVAAGLVDAHAGALALLGPCASDPPALDSRRALIAGTSTCIMGFRPEPIQIPGLWGPCADAVLPGFWMLEGGQSASGATLDYLCRRWSGERGSDLQDRAMLRIAELIAAEGPDLAPRLHVLPDFHGNRAPYCDSEALGVISGLDLDGSFDGFCRLFWRTCTGLALGLRQILDLQASYGWPAERLHIAGGHTRSLLLVQLYADATNTTIELPAVPDPVLLGTAMGAAAAGALFRDLAAAACAMGAQTQTIEPDPTSRSRLARDYSAFLALARHRTEIDAIAREAYFPNQPPPLQRGTLRFAFR